jgi:anti-sigma-K factor RskA
MNPNLHALTGAYALDALDPTERQEFTEHLAECVECREEVASFRAAAIRMAAGQVTPPTGLRDAVLAEVARTAQAGSVETSNPGADASDVPAGAPHVAAARARIRRWPALVAAAAVVAVTAVGGTAVYREREAAIAAAAMQSKAMRIASAPDAISMDVDLGATHLVVSSEMRAAALMGEDVPMPAVGGDVYQVWMMHADGSAAPGPTFLPHDGELMVIVEGDLTDVTEVAVTVEPRGGSAEPSDQMVAHVSL